MRTAVARFLALPPADQRLLALAIGVQPVLRIALRIAGLRRCQAALRAPAPPSGASGGTGQQSLAEAAGVSRLLCAAERRRLLDPNCLVHSLTLWWLLRRRGIDGHVCIGVRRSGGTLEAHAWVEHAGTALGEVEDVARRFVPLAAPAHLDRSLPAS